MRYVVVAVAVACAVCGCVVIRDTEKEWRENETRFTLDGPGNEDARIVQWSKNRFEVDSGRRIAIGFFPGAGEFNETKYVKWEDLEAKSWFDYWVSVTVGQPFALFVPTVESLLITPFIVPTNPASGFSLVGCHRWQGTGQPDKVVEKRPSATFLKKAGFFLVLQGRDTVGKTEDGTDLHWRYPGFDVLVESARSKGQVAVVDSDGAIAYRRFRLSPSVADGLEFEDVRKGADSIADRWIAYQREMRGIKPTCTALTSAPGYAFCDANVSNAVTALRRKVDALIADSQANDLKTVATVRAEISDLKGKLEIAAKKEIERLLSAAEWKHALRLCDALLPPDGEDSDGDLEMWVSERKNKAVAELEKIRIAEERRQREEETRRKEAARARQKAERVRRREARLKDARKLFADKDWNAVIALCRSELQHMPLVTFERNMPVVAAERKPFEALLKQAKDELTRQAMIEAELKAQQLIEQIEQKRRIQAAKTGGLYCVIDLSGGPNAAEWPVSSLSAMPTGGWTDEYKTTKLVLRRIEAGTFIMGDTDDESHRVTLTKPFYMGVFEVTQRQWKLVMGNGNFIVAFGRGGTFPAYGVSYDGVRGSSLGAQWPTSSEVDASSFLGRLRAKTGLDFDLPTEAQWEYACRAGTETLYYWGDEMDYDYAWCKGSFADWEDPHGKAHPVGMKRPNAWGLYDMSGNLLELCRDWYDLWQLTYGTDPVGVASGSLRVARGGTWALSADRCTSYFRIPVPPVPVFVLGFCSGFRLSLALL